WAGGGPALVLHGVGHREVTAAPHAGRRTGHRGLDQVGRGWRRRGRRQRDDVVLVGADVGGRARGPRQTFEVGGHVGRRQRRVAGRSMRAQVIVAGGGGDEEGGRRGGERVQVLAGGLTPGGQGEHRVAPVR